MVEMWQKSCLQKVSKGGMNISRKQNRKTESRIKQKNNIIQEINIQEIILSYKDIIE